MKRAAWTYLVVTMVAGPLVLVRAEADKPDQQPRRQSAAKLKQQGHWKEAYEAFAKLATDPADDPMKVAGDLNNAVYCLNRLGRVNEFDGFVEKVIAAHGRNWRLLAAAAQSYMGAAHYGALIAGEFQRGRHRGRAKYVNAYERDRVRALQLMVQGTAHTAGEKDKAGAAEFYMKLANMLLANRGFGEAWRLQYASDLSELPDYEPGYYYYRGGSARGAPVKEDGSCVYHSLPKSWKTARTDGERWRWALEQVAEHNPARQAEVRYHFASFLHHQFGVQTMRQYQWFFGRHRQPSDSRKDTSGTYELHTLGEDETIARLATGIRRFKLPKEFSFLRIFKQLADGGSHAQTSLDTLAGVFENRRQYPRAAELWKQAIDRFGAGNKAWRKKRLDQVVGNWGMFEPVTTSPAGKGATVEFRFRNGGNVSFQAHEIDTRKLLNDVKAYIKAKPARLDWNQANVGNVGYRLVVKNQKQYLGKRVASWDLDLKPRPRHFDSRITVATPLQRPGAYLLTAKMAGGNVSRVVLWVADTAIVKKPLDKGTYYFVADARTGKPIAKANLEFFGYWQQYVSGKGRERGHYVVHTRNFAEFSDADGQVILKPDAQLRNYRWLITATTPAGRLAYLGFTGVWHGDHYDRQYNATKVFVITDRPVYRPDQAIKFKFWVNHAQYDREGKSAYAGLKFTVRVNDPQGKKAFEKAYTADEYGGFDGELTLGKEATLGVYRIHLPGDRNPLSGGGSFRLEEYKKPEFEVKIEAPKEPVMLGEKITATIQSKYYFGAPVTKAKVKYKVLRSDYSARWYPVCPWDWFYGPGYWWFACDYAWYPGWKRWGCRRPLPWWWWRWHPRKQPEVVAEAEVPVGPDGTVKVTIDTAVAKAVYGDTDHKYEITAEVTDQSRRTIVGVGSVLVARKPFKVYAWVNRGHYRVGDTIHASFKAQTLDRKPVRGEGVLKLLKVRYQADKDTGRLTPAETEVGKWDIDTNAEGRATQQIKASERGQYRLSYTLTDAKKHRIEGGYVFVIRGEGFDGSEFRFNDIELVTDRREYAPGEKVKLMVNTNRPGAAVVLFVRPANGIGLPPKVLRLEGKSITEEIAVLKKDMPNFYVEAFTVHGGKVHTETREVVVPPASRVLNVKVEHAKDSYKPGEKAKVAVKVTDSTGEPFTGSLVLSIYDKAVEYVSGGSNVPEIKEFFWKWRRRHYPRTETSLSKGGRNQVGRAGIAQRLRRVERAGDHGVLLEVAPAPLPADGDQPQQGRAQPGSQRGDRHALPGGVRLLGGG